MLNRREFLAATAAAMGLQATGQEVRITFGRAFRYGAIPADFTGLGYEISSVATTGLLSAKNEKYVQLVKALGANGVIRVGGNTSDFSSYSAKGQAVSSPTGTVVNRKALRDLGSFLEATGWRLIWGLNLGSGTQQQAVEEAEAVAATCGKKLLAFEIGNEPDDFGHVHRSGVYGYEDYLQEYRSYKAAVRRKLPDAPFAGPDVAGATDWVTHFSHDEGSDLKLLTHHYYRECAGPGSTLEKLLLPDPKLIPQLEKLRAASTASSVPYRICETNSFCGGGKPGVSDTFGAALWVLDFMFLLASYNCAGVNMETGVNQMGFISSYSPIADSAKPEYYGMLAFAQASGGERLAVKCDAAGVNVTSYAVEGKVTIINKDLSRDVTAVIIGLEGFGSGRVTRLSSRGLESAESLSNKAGRFEVPVPAGSAAIVELRI